MTGVESGGEPEALAPRPDSRTVAIVGLFLLGLLYTLYFARGFLLPIAIAVLLNLLLSPVVRGLKRLRIPTAFGAALIVVAMLGLVGSAIYALAGPAEELVAKGPASLQKATARIRQLRRPMEQVNRTAEQVVRATQGRTEGQPTEVVVRGPTVGSRLLGATRSFLTSALSIVMLLYFLLATGDLFTLKLVRVLPQFGDRKRAVSIINATEASVSKYLGTVALLNLGQGVVVWIAMSTIGLPNAELWGALAGIAEFVPYVGALVMVAVLTVAGLATFDDLGRALMVPGAFLLINIVQANVVSPLVMGRRLALNPVAIFIGLAFWLWVWGLPGAFLAVPIIATLKIWCDHFEALGPLGEFLGK